MDVITHFSVFSHCNDLGGKVWNPAIKWTHKYAVFVQLTDSHGNTGLGECWCFDSKPDALIAFLQTEVAPHVIGTATKDLPRLASQLLSRATLTARHGILSSALSGVDIAMWDLRSKVHNLPLWALLRNDLPSNVVNQNADGQVYLYASGGLYGQDKSIAVLQAEMTAMKAAGFNLLKMKTGGLSLDDDLQRINAVLHAIGNDCQLIIDGVYSYSAELAIELYDSLPQERIAAFQSPLKADDFAGMQMLVKHGIPVMGTEAEYRSELHHDLIEKKCVAYLQAAPIACGGISRLTQLDSLLANRDEMLSLEVSSTAVALLAAMHYAAASKQVIHTEYHTVHQVFFDLLQIHAVDGRSGWFDLPDIPGIGISLPMTEVTIGFELEL